MAQVSPAQASSAPAPSSLIRPGHNAWRRERAGRAAVLIDAGQYFGAVREALLNARSTAFIIGWDLDSRTRLVGEDCRADDGFPEGLIEFLSAIVKRRPRAPHSRFGLGLLDPLRDRARAVSDRVGALGHAAANPLLPRRRPAVRRLAASEDRRGRRRGGVLGRARPHHPALGHARASPRRSAPRRSRRRALCPVPRRAGDGRRQGRRRARGARARALGARRLRARAAGPSGRRSVAAKHHAGPDRHRRRHRPHQPCPRRRERDPRGRARCSSTWSIAPSAASISRTSISPRNASPSVLRSG